MTGFYLTTQSRWEAALENYTAARTAADAVLSLGDSHARNQILNLLGETIDTILRIPAPKLGSVADKLLAFWHATVFGEGEVDGFRRTIIGDLRRIERQLAGVEEPEASGGMDPWDVRFDWREAIDEYDECKQLVAQGPLDGRFLDEMFVRLDQAEAELLGLPAPDLEAVLRKLEIIWSNDWYDPIDDCADHLRIMRDLRRFAATHRASEAGNDVADGDDRPSE